MTICLRNIPMKVCTYHEAKACGADSAAIWKLSRLATIDCAHEVGEAATKEKYESCDWIDGMIDKYGFDRFKFVLAVTVKRMRGSYIRFHREAFTDAVANWADSVLDGATILKSEDYVREFTCWTDNPSGVNDIITRIMNDYD